MAMNRSVLEQVSSYEQLLSTLPCHNQGASLRILYIHKNYPVYVYGRYFTGPGDAGVDVFGATAQI